MYEWRLTGRLRTAITLAALAVLMLLGVSWGWAQMTKPFPGKAEALTCVDTSYKPGDELTAQEVTVSVLNASSREGLAARTLGELHTAGFAEGKTANAPKGTSVTGPAEIWVDDVNGPAAKLLRGQLGRVPVVQHPEANYPGAIVVVGDAYDALLDGPESITVDKDAVVCSPPVE